MDDLPDLYLDDEEEVGPWWLVERRVEDDLEFLKSVSSQAELMEGMDRFGKSAADLMSQAAKRQYELKDPGEEDDNCGWSC